MDFKFSIEKNIHFSMKIYTFEKKKTTKGSTPINPSERRHDNAKLDFDSQHNETKTLLKGYSAC